MVKFSVLGAAFSGYRLLLTRPVTALWWFAYSLGMTCLMMAMLSLMAGEAMFAFQDIMGNMKPGEQPDQSTLQVISREMQGYNNLSFLLMIVMTVMSTGAVMRAVLRPKNSAFGYLRFWGDELRLILVMIVLGIIILGAAAVLSVVTVIVGVALVGSGGGFAALRAGQGLAPYVLVIVGLLSFATLAVALFLAVRLSLASALTVGERGIRIFETWGLTKGRFWRILTALLLAAIPAIAVYVAVTFARFQMTHEKITDFWSLYRAWGNSVGDVRTLASTFAPNSWLFYITGAIAATVGMAGMTAPTAYIYAALADERAASQTDDDDDDDD